MKFLNIALFISIFLTQLSAEETYKRILITKTLSENSLKEIKSKLNTLNIKMYLKRSHRNNNYYYYVYSKKYKNNRYLQRDLKKIKTIFKNAYMLGNKKSLAMGDENSTDKDNEIALSPYFMSATLGFASIGGSSDNASFNQLNSSGLSYGLEGGYILYDNIFISLGINSSSSDVRLNNIYLSSYYQYNPTKNIGLYGGMLVGYSILELNNYKYTEPSTSSSVGLQLGFKYSFDKNLSLFTSYQGLLMDHVIEINDDDSEIKFNFMHNLQFGILYRF
ncbi:MAG: outer membrane beta-barrel protein [Campylobacterota bacterium]|nr:outer membrane beta-barrel protein [Campylobacterota bacterium]